MTVSREQFASHRAALESVESLQTWIKAFEREYKKREAALEEEPDHLAEMNLHAAVLREKVRASVDSHSWESEHGNLWHHYSDLARRFEEYKAKYADKPVGTKGDFQSIEPE